MGQRTRGRQLLVLRDGKDISGLLRIEGSMKDWTDKGGR